MGAKHAYRSKTRVHDAFSDRAVLPPSDASGGGPLGGARRGGAPRGEGRAEGGEARGEGGGGEPEEEAPDGEPPALGVARSGPEPLFQTLLGVQTVLESSIQKHETRQ